MKLLRSTFCNNLVLQKYNNQHKLYRAYLVINKMKSLLKKLFIDWLYFEIMNYLCLANLLFKFSIQSLISKTVRKVKILRKFTTYVCRPESRESKYMHCTDITHVIVIKQLFCAKFCFCLKFDLLYARQSQQ